MLAIFIIGNLPDLKVGAAGTISGRVFQDYNGNGVYDTAGSAALPAIDAGVGGVTVMVYDSLGGLVGTATTSAVPATLGQYSIATPTAGSYRVEFTGLSGGFQPSARSTDSFAGGTATNAGSTVQFATDNTPNVNLAVNVAEDYCQNNPESASCNYSFGNQTVAPSSTTTGLLTFPYTAGSTDTTTTFTGDVDLPNYTLTTNSFLNVTATNIGTTFGLAYARSSRLLYAGAYFKRHTGFGTGADNTLNTADDAGAVYVIDRTGNSNKGSVTSKFTVPNATTNAHNTADYQTDNGNTGWDGVGKTSLGGMAVSDDSSALFVMNLQNRTLYRRNLTDGTFISQVVPTTGLATANGTCAATDVRPFAVTYYRNEVYVGMICSGESSATVDTFTDVAGGTAGVYDTNEYYLDSNNDGVYNAGEPYYDQNGSGTYNAGDTFVDTDGNGVYNLGDARKLTAYVFRVNPASLAFGASPAFSAPLNYKRGINQQGLGAIAVWKPWSATYRSTNATANRTVYSQPMLTGIAFDRGNLVLGLRDRVGDQVGHQTQSNPNDTTATLYQPRTGGDTLRACVNVSNGWTLEANGRCGIIPTGSAPQNTDQGPENASSAGGEFYYGDSYDLAFAFSQPAGQTDIAGKGANHDEVSLGGVAQMPGAADVMATIFDPIPNVPNETHDGGVRWLNNTTGNFAKAYRIYNGVTTTLGTLGKANGVGDLELLCDSAPIELGNRVWNDDGDGVQEPGEAGIPNVTVRLFNNLNVLIATAVTDANGEYYFTSGTAADGDITNNIGIVNGQITPNTDYQIRFDAAANYTGAGALANRLMTTRDQTSQAGFDEGSDSDSSLVVNPTGSPTGTFPVIAVTTGTAGSNNHNLDVGFASSATYSIGNRVWFDTDNDGQIDAVESGISGVSVSLFLDANGDGTPDTPSTPVGTQTTDTNGYYRFDTLAANTYVVRINPTNFIGSEDADTTDALVGYRNTTNSNATDLDSTSVAGQNGENGIDPIGAATIVRTNGILSAAIALGAPGEPVSEADVAASGQGAIDAAANMTIDFGFYRLNLSGTVWRDTGAGANTNNGTLDALETGIASVFVRLYDSANAEIPVGPDGILGTSDDANGGMATDSNGNYNFQGLPPGTYRVVVTSNGATSSTPTSITPDDNINSNDDGTPQTAGVFSGRTTSGLVTLTPGNAGSLNNNAILNTNGSTSNPTVDFGFVTSATAIGLESFEAFAGLNGGVTLKWSTGSETDNLGFNVYREVNGKRELLNNSPIAGSALRSNVNLQASGDSYSWTDAQSVPDAVYYLEDIDLDGGTNLHGAVSAKMQFSGITTDLKSRLLSDLTKVSAPNQTDSAANASVKPKAGNKIVQNTIAAQTGVKITVRSDGWYRISAQQLQAAGFEVNSNQANWQMFVNGEEIPFKLNADNSVEFFGRGLDTLATDQQAYYLTVGNRQGRRITEVKGGNAGETADARSFRNVAVLRDREVYASAILNGEAENWFGAFVGSSAQTEQELTIYNPDTNGGNARLSVKLQGLTNSEHLVSIRFNDLDLGAVSYSNRENRVFEFDVPMSLVQSGKNRISLQAIGAGSDMSLVDTITLNYARSYKVENDRLRFTVPAGQTVRVGGFSNREFEVYEIRGGKVSAQIAVETEEVDETAGFSLAAANLNREFLAVGKLQNEPAVSVENDTASDWRNPSNKADFVIITPNVFRESAAQLAELRRSQGLKTEVVAVEDLYDEFTFGAHSPVAVQEFLRTATSQWKVKPQYALLFGDSSYDSRNYLGGTNRDFVPTKLIDTEVLETASDASLADFNNDGIEDIALGRLPVVNQTEAALMISKIQRYERENIREEKSNLFVADTNFENYSNTLNGLLPAGVSSSFVNRTGTTNSEMHQSLLEKLNQNTTVVTYSGHGSTTLLANSNVFRNEDALTLNNQKLSFYLMMTCLNGYTHNPWADTLAEALMKADNGAIAVWASSGVTYADGQSQLSQAATNLLFNAPQPLRIGAVVRNAKLGTSDQDIRRTWQLIGDPTIFIR